MREIRTSGSEGGGGDSPYPYRDIRCTKARVRFITSLKWMLTSISVANPQRKTGMARSLRRRMTASERRLWSRLCGKKFLSLQFQRQAPIGPYIVDFYCSVARLVVELDGDAHSFTLEQDKARQAYLEEGGISVIRFLNYDVLHSLDFVLERICERCSAHVQVWEPDGCADEEDQ